MPEYTTTDAAALLGTDRRNVQNYCRRHELKKFGREYVVTEMDIEGMRTELGKVGRKPRNRVTKNTDRNTIAIEAERAAWYAYDSAPMHQDAEPA